MPQPAKLLPSGFGPSPAARADVITGGKNTVTKTSSSSPYTQPLRTPGSAKKTPKKNLTPPTSACLDDAMSDATLVDGYTTLQCFLEWWKRHKDENFPIFIDAEWRPESLNQEMMINENGTGGDQNTAGKNQ